MPETLVPNTLRMESPEAELLFSTARISASEEIAERVRTAVGKNINWIYLIQLAMQHGTTALLYAHLRRACPGSVPPGVLEPLAARYKSQFSEARHRAEELTHILAAFEAQSIFALPYKGPVLASRLYGSLALREFSQFSDLDILVHERDLPKARAVVIREGYEEHSRTEREWIFRQRSGGRFLELQWHFTTYLCRVADDPDRFLRRLETVPLAGAMVRTLSLEDYFLVLSLHATKHKWRQLKLVCDIAEILASPEVDWEYVLREADELGVRRILALGVLLAEDPLKVVTPSKLARGLKIDRAARDLAAECRQEWSKRPDDYWRFHADIRFMVRVRERAYDKLKLLLWDWLWPDSMPDEDDQRFVALSPRFSALYYLLRPVRLVCKEIGDRS